MRRIKIPKLIDQFSNRWYETISKIETTPMPSSETNKIIMELKEDTRDLLLSESLFKESTKGKPRDWKFQHEYNLDRIHETRVRLISACAISNSKWKSLHPGFFDRIYIRLEQISLSLFNQNKK